MIQLQAYQVADFSGGITDKFVDAPPNAAQTCDNLEITINRKLLSRPGSRLYNSSYAKAISGETSRVSSLIGYDNDTDLLTLVNKRLFRYTVGGWSELLGPASSPAFATGSAATTYSHTQGLKHLILANDAHHPILKVYRDNAGELKLRTAGLPALASLPTITGSGGTPKVVTITIATPGVFTTSSAHGLSINTRVKFSTTGALPTGLNTATTYFVKTTPTATTFTVSDTLGGTEVATSGAQSGTHSVLSYPNQYLYAFVYRYSYNVEDKTFEDYGPTSQTTSIVYGSDPSASFGASITGIPVLANSGGSHYDTANIKVQIYRTQNAGSIFYYVGEVANTTTTFTDNVPDTTLRLNATLYTTGDVLDNDPPPPAKVVHIAANNVCYFGNVKEGSQTLPTRIRQSVANDFDSCPADFWVDLNTEIVGLSSVRGTLIALTKKGIYRVDGIFDETGNGGMIAQVIDDTVDCVSHNSIVQVLDGIVWCASDGVYFSDGYKVLKISQELDDTYASFITNNKTKIVGTYDATVKRVYWAVQASSISSDLDKLLVLDLRWGIKPQSTFTTWSGGTSFSPTAILFYNKQLIRGDKRGYILKHSTDYQSDIEIDDLVAVNNWKNIPIVFDYVSPATSFGSVAQRKWVPKITLVLDAITNISLQIQGINDGRRKVKALAPIIFRSRVTWGDPSLEWGDSAVIWNFEGTLQEIRRFPAGGLRTSYKQIEITNASANLYKSDTYGLGTVNTTTDTLTLNNYVPGNVIWPSDVVGYYITFDIDDYTKEYLITGRTDSVITFLDPQNDSVAGAHKWLIRGYNKDEVLSLQSYAIYYSAYSDSITNYQGVVGANKT